MIPVFQRILGLEALPITLYMGPYLLSPLLVRIHYDFEISTSQIFFSPPTPSLSHSIVMLKRLRTSTMMHAYLFSYTNWRKTASALQREVSLDI